MNSSFNDIKTNEMLIQQQLDSVISELKIEKKLFFFGLLIESCTLVYYKPRYFLEEFYAYSNCR